MNSIQQFIFIFLLLDIETIEFVREKIAWSNRGVISSYEKGSR